jgi:hypothetical protein
MDQRRCVSRPPLGPPKALLARLLLLLSCLLWWGNDAAVGPRFAAASAFVAVHVPPPPAAGGPVAAGAPRFVPRTSAATTTTTPHRSSVAAAVSAARSSRLLLLLSRRNVAPLGARRDRRSSDPREEGGALFEDGEEENDDTDDRRFDRGQQGATGGLSPPPVYDRRALARAVFADPFFYDYKPGAAELYRDEREAALGESTTVEQVFLQYMVPPGDVSELVRKIKATDRRLLAYFAPAAARIEDVLAQRQKVGLSSGDELRKVHRRYVKGLPAVDRVVRRSLSHPDDSTRNRRRLCYIFGPSGSGKTFFATNEMRSFGSSQADDGDGNLPAVTLYFTPAAVALHRRDGNVVANDGDDETVPIDFRRDDDDAPNRLVKKVVSLLDNAIRGWGRTWNRSKLQMHVSLVFDEAGAWALNGFFDKRVQVDRVLTLAQEKIATSVTVVVVGTGLTEFAYDSTREVCVFRMGRWGRDDLERILVERERFMNKLRPGESVRTAVNAAFSQPALAALATNARCAGFLANSFEKTARLATYSWNDHLGMVAPEVVSRVMLQYEEENAVSSLRATQRRRIAAWVFAALATREKGSTMLPELDGLDRQERAVAASLLQYNVETLDGAPALVGSNQFSASVTPALAIILYSMCGVPASVLIGWKCIEETAALYAVRRLIVEEGEKQICRIRSLQQSYVANRPRMSLREFELELDKLGESTADKYNSERRSSENAFGKSQSKICLIRLTTRLQRPPSRTSLVSIPRVPTATVLLNGEESSYAAVIAPYTFIQTKSALHSRIHVNIARELENCCLLKNSRDDRMLRGLMMVWDGCFSNSEVGDYVDDELDVMAANEALHQESVAYPENLIEVRPPSDPVPGYVTIDSDCNIQAGCEQSQLRLPSLPSHRSVEFILFTNAESIHLTFLDESQQERAVLVNRTVLGDDLQLRSGTIGEATSWNTFLADRVLPGVNIRFVFTNPSDASTSVAS